VDGWCLSSSPAVKQVHAAQEVVNERRAGMMVNLVGAADLLDAAFVHHCNPVGNFQRLFLIVGDEHAGDVHFVVQLAQPAAQLQTDLRVQRAERFVEQQDAGFDRQSACQRDPLALASGELRRITARQILQLDQSPAIRGPWRESALSTDAHFAGRTLSPKGDVLEHGHVPEERVVLEDKADAAVAGIAMRSVFAIEENVAGVGEFQSGDDAQQRGLAGARRSQQRHQFARRNLRLTWSRAVNCPNFLVMSFASMLMRVCPSSAQRRTPPADAALSTRPQS
jgi:hypothetical protein